MNKGRGEKLILVGKCKRERERRTNGQTHREIERKRETETHRYRDTDRQTDRQTDNRQTGRRTYIQTGSLRETHTETDKVKKRNTITQHKY